MNVYAEPPLFSGKKGAVFTAVILLHLMFGFALYSELAARFGTRPDSGPLNLVPTVRVAKDPIKPPPVTPLIDQLRIYSTPPEFPRLTAMESDTVVLAPPDPPTTATQPTPPRAASTEVRMDPKHPLRIGEAYYPDASRRANEMGRCLVRVTVATDGRIVAAAIQSSTGFDRLDQACLNAVRGQRMLPATEDGQPVQSTASIPIHWNLTER